MKRRVSRTERALDALIVLVIILVLAGLALGLRSCALRGGHYVRGLVWMECIR